MYRARGECESHGRLRLPQVVGGLNATRCPVRVLGTTSSIGDNLGWILYEHNVAVVVASSARENECQNTAQQMGRRQALHRDDETAGQTGLVALPVTARGFDCSIGLLRCTGGVGDQTGAVLQRQGSDAGASATVKRVHSIAKGASARVDRQACQAVRLVL